VANTKLTLNNGCTIVFIRLTQDVAYQFDKEVRLMIYGALVGISMHKKVIIGAPYKAYLIPNDRQIFHTHVSTAVGCTGIISIP